ncbi:MAG: glycine--tRNA ligase subunit beta [Vicinamibacteria bacterium]|nr:glycine--tRNA ligase subunit beta [Vicinamibacteria bacterium]
MAEFLFEIGFEEMPAPWLKGLADQLLSKFTAVAADEQLAPQEVRVFWTARRLVLVAQVNERQEDRTVVEWGPAAKIAKDAAGNWSKAAEGFAKKQGVPLDALKLAPKAEGSSDLYVSATKQIVGRPTGDVLAGALPAILRSFNFAKRMNWDAWLDDGRGAFEFGRPIQWLVALLDGEVVPLTIFDAVGGAKGAARVMAGRRSLGHRFYPRGASDRGFDVRSFSELDAGLAARFVILDPARRRDRIKWNVEAAGGEVAGEAAHLVQEWADLVEYPTVVVGSIPPEFADLPDEVLETVLAHHQKAITLPRGKDGSPRFAAISGCDDAGAVNAAQGQERVVIARLKDARFFYNEDRKRTIESRVDDLAAVTFHKGLGTYKQKAERISLLATNLAGHVGLSADITTAAGRAALFAKADLVTLMVREFPELQGVMGGLYAQATEPAGIAQAIRWHYHPVAVEPDAAPAGRLSGEALETFALVALVDKLDTLIGYLGIGVTPSGSSDPYGLRRAGQGVIRILLDFWTGKAPNLDDVVADGHRLYGASVSKPTKELQSALRAFLLDRLRGVLVARNAGSSDEIDAVLDARVDPLADVRDVAKRLHALSAVRSEQREVFAALAEAFKRAKNIVAGTKVGAVDQAAFVEGAEGLLHAAIVKAESAPAADPASRLRAVAAVRGEVDSFFKSVMVMADDPVLKTNRLALLSRLLNLVYEVADLSKLASPAGDSATSS